MTRLYVIALTVILALIIGVIVFGLPGWIATTAIALAIGIGIGFAAGAGRARPNSTVASENPEVAVTAKLLDVALDEMREGLLVIDTDMRVVASNKAAREVLAEAQSIQDRRLTELTRSPAVYDAFLDALNGEQRDAVRVETYDNGRKVFDLRVVPFHSSGNGRIAGAVGVLFDITRLDRLETVRQEFLANVSHELRTPLTSILASAETLEAGAIKNADNSQRFLSIIQKNATRMQHLIHDLLELGAIESGSVMVNPEPVQLKPLVDDVISTLAIAAADRKIDVCNLVAADVRVFADPHRLMQMLTNLVDNAVKFNREGGTVSVKHVTVDRADQIFVNDTGEGIPTHHVDRLFERFYRVDRARSLDLGGTGLGLAIVKHLAKAHGGEVSVTSRIGQGTQFLIELPRKGARNGGA